MQPVLYLDYAAIRRLNLHQLISEAVTVIELAARTGLTRGAIQHYKSGFRNIGDEGARSLEDGMVGCCRFSGHRPKLLELAQTVSD
ncbi:MULTISPECIES: hypothetical protein [Ralstonia]|jgi:hypothetical protein|uniref:hypothetical protein n=1 Tax=Ralstonia TaxID=48736 RepID=UPI001268E235|nr:MULTISPECIES: hypothetical protein [Ralstonia]